MNQGILSLPAGPGSAGSVLVADGVGGQSRKLILPQSLGYSTPQTGRNKIINGAMNIQERSISGTVSAGTCPIDRWKYNKSGAATHTIARDTDVPGFALTGGRTNFGFSLKLTCTAGAALGAGDYYQMYQPIQGVTMQALFGRTVTLSFWAKAVHSGIYCIYFQSATGDQIFIAEYYLPPSTWTFVQITIPPTTIGTWNLTSVGVGGYIVFEIACGSTNQGTVYAPVGAPKGFGAWSATAKQSTPNCVNGVQNTGDNFWFTGVGLETGDTATEFEFVDYSTELRRCQHYYYRRGTLDDTNNPLANGFMEGINAASYSVFFPVQMRAVPAFTLGPGSAAGTDYYCEGYNAAGTANIDAVPTAIVIINTHWQSRDGSGIQSLGHSLSIQNGGGCILIGRTALAQLCFDAEL